MCTAGRSRCRSTSSSCRARCPASCCAEARIDASAAASGHRAKALLLDPALFTAPYDAALSRGLATAGVEVRWLTRPLRSGEEALLPPEGVRPVFYRLTDGPRRRTGGLAKAVKGAEHVAGMLAARRDAASWRPDVIHLQWLVVPLLDAWAVRRLRRIAPVVMTVHDVTPFNGKQVSALQRRGFTQALALADRLIVHTEGARAQLAAGGLSGARIDVVPHGLLEAPRGPRKERAARWRIVQFGRIQQYKGVDLLIEALGRIAPADRARIEVVVAGEPQIGTEPLLRRARDLGLDDTIDFRLGFLSEQAMGDLLASADAFVFPYRTIEASGVLHLVAGLERLVVASDTGAFPDLLGRDGAAGTLVDPTDPDRLAAALVATIGRHPTRGIGDAVPGWDEIGRRTRDTYDRARAAWREADPR